MRRVVLSVTIAVAFVGGTASAASAADPNTSPSPVVGPATKGKKACGFADERLTEISGMVATGTGYTVVNNGSGLDSHKKIFILDGKCAVSKTVSFSGNGANDPEDLAVAKDGTLWVADIGDGGKSRDTIALWKLAKGSTTPVIYRLSYPDGRHDAGALVMGTNGTPVIVTKDATTPRLYSPVGALQTGKTVKLQKVGTFTLPKTTTSNPLAAVGRLIVTGGAVSPDGSKVTLRTYADAIEFDVSNGNLVDSIVKGVPRITPLPDEPRGEAITYSADGTTFLTVSQTAQATDGSKPTVLRYTPVAPAASKSPATVKEGTVSKASGPSWFNRLSLTDITYIIGAIGVIGLLLVGVGVFGIVRARRRPPVDEVAAGSGAAPDGAPVGRATAMVTLPREEAPYGQDPSVWGPAGYDEYAPPGSGQAGHQQYAGAGGSAGSGGTYRSSGSAVPPGQAGVRDPASSRGSRGSGGEYRSGGSGGTYRSGGVAGSGGPAGPAGSDGSRGPAASGGDYRSGGSYRSGGGSHSSGADYEAGPAGRQYRPTGRGTDRPAGYPDRGGVYGGGGGGYDQEEPRTGDGYQRGQSYDYDYADPDPRARY